MAFDLANLRQLPALANRPNFPSGLNVVLVDSETKPREEAEQLLRENYYAVVAFASSAEAAAYISNPENAVDVLLSDVRCLQQKTPENAALVAACKSLPLVLMSETGAPHEVMLGIKFGAVDFLEKPLSPLKLKNIWQHTVRRLIAAHPNAPSHLKKGAAASGTASPEDSAGAGSGQQSHHASENESGSNASTSDQAAVKLEVDADMESSFQEMMGMTSLALSCGMTRLSEGELDGAGGGGGGINSGSGLPSSSGTGAGPSDAGADGNMPNGGLRPQPQKYRAARPNVPSSNGSGGSSSGPKPAIGYPAGQMPPLPSGVPGIEWGLPTNPLQISPKAPMAGMGGMSGMGGMMGGMGGMGPWGAGCNPMMAQSMFSGMGGVNSMSPMSPMMMSSPSPSAGTSSMTLPSAPSMCAGPMGQPQPMHAQHPMGMHMSNSCLTLSSVGAGGMGSMAPAAAAAMKRAESAPLPALSSVSTAGAAGPSSGAMDGLMPPPPSRGAGNTGGKANILLGIEPGKAAARPTFGLQLKKSPSLVDFISQAMTHGSLM